jgi:hypothetical protein
MSDRRHDEDRTLTAIDRLRQLDLERARTESAATEQRVARERAALNAIEESVKSTQGWARDQITAQQTLNVDGLQRVCDYSGWQARAVDESTTRLQTSERAAQDALAQVGERFRDAAVIERLQQRRADLARRDDERREARVLDDRAAVQKYESQRQESTEEEPWPSTP